MSATSVRRTGPAGRVGMLVAGLAAVGLLAIGNDHASAAATNAGALTVKNDQGAALSSGGSATSFALVPPTGAACSGDTATGGYKWSSYMVPSSVNPASLTFDNNGPLPQGLGASFREPLFSSGQPVVNKNTAVNTGLLTGLPLYSLAGVGFSPGDIPAGTYNLGYACIKGAAGPSQLDKYWNVQLTFAADGADPLGVSWTVASVVTTTTIATTTTIPVTTTTAAGGTTTVADSSTTVLDTSTSSSDASSSTDSSTTIAATSTSLAGSGGSLAGTGSNAARWLAIAILVMIAGRFAVLAARRVRVLPPK